jgi:hypothetical protein
MNNNRAYQNRKHNIGKKQGKENNKFFRRVEYYIGKKKLGVLAGVVYSNIGI